MVDYLGKVGSMRILRYRAESTLGIPSSRFNCDNAAYHPCHPPAWPVESPRDAPLEAPLDVTNVTNGVVKSSAVIPVACAEEGIAALALTV